MKRLNSHVHTEASSKTQMGLELRSKRVLLHEEKSIVIVFDASKTQKTQVSTGLATSYHPFDDFHFDFFFV
jgi:hypothetical protein